MLLNVVTKTNYEAGKIYPLFMEVGCKIKSIKQAILPQFFTQNLSCVENLIFYGERIEFKNSKLEREKDTSLLSASIILEKFLREV